MKSIKFIANKLASVSNPNYNTRIVFSYSLYGNADVYIYGLYRNCKVINAIYPSAWIYIYIGNDFDKSILQFITHNVQNVKYIETYVSGHLNMIHRFTSIDYPEVSIAFSRDADSIINERDVYCINTFMNSNKRFQIIRDNVAHDAEILGGMWGIKRGLLRSNIKDLINDFSLTKHPLAGLRGYDQTFLKNVIYPIVKDDSIVFDEFFQYHGETPIRINCGVPYSNINHVGSVYIPTEIVEYPNSNTISGYSFARKCKWTLCNRYLLMNRFSFYDSKDGDSIFINTDIIDKIHLFIPKETNNKYVFVFHNSDRAFGTNELNVVKKYAKHIFAINTNVQDELLTSIPLGFVDKQLDFISKFTYSPQPRNIEIYMNFSLHTNLQKRKQCFDIFKNNPNVITNHNISVDEYYSDLSRSKYVLCPEGTGIDTHRIYEAILCGAIPVVLRNSLESLYLKFPVCIVDSWTDPFYIPQCQDYSFDSSSYISLKRIQ